MHKVPALILAAAAGHAAAASIDVRVRDPAGKPVPDVAVYATSAATPGETKTAKTIAIEQLDREFVPYVSVIQVGTTVEFPNRDRIQHHVYSFSPAKTFEFKLYTGKSPGAVLFDKTGIVTIGCNIHDWMIAYVLVVATPHFAKTDRDGVARLRDLRAGSYEVRLWHPQQTSAPVGAVSSLEGAAATAALDLAIEVEPRKAKYKPPLDAQRY
jgi:plastocyanin